MLLRFGKLDRKGTSMRVTIALTRAATVIAAMRMVPTRASRRPRPETDHDGDHVDVSVEVVALWKLVGDRMERGLIPPDHDAAADPVTDVCYRNAAAWFLEGDGSTGACAGAPGIAPLPRRRPLPIVVEPDPTAAEPVMAEIHHLRRSPPPRRPKMSCDTLARLTFLAGGVAAFLSFYVPGLGGLSTLVGLGVAIGGYAGFYDRCR